MTLPPRRVAPHKWAPVGVDQLEQSALRIVRSDNHRSVLAGPGAGKTELLAQRAAYVLQTNACRSPQRILAISFKRDAARNLALRVQQRCHREHSDRFDSLTFDAFAKGLLDRFGQALPERWRPTPDYEIFYPKLNFYRDFLRTASQSPERVGTEAEIQAIVAENFEKDHVVKSKLQAKPRSVPTASDWVKDAYWQHMLHDGERSQLTFPMIGRLVELLLRVNESARLAHVLTYSHVFMDEFQDTTRVQYDLIKTLFLDTETVITAVGDNKQQIMRWAMAMARPFDTFERDFGAKRASLLNNYRSSPDLVRIQHVLAQALDASTPPARSKTKGTVSGDCCAVWDFTSRRSEAHTLARFISAEIKEYGLRPRDFVVLVRQKADEYAEELAEHFEKEDILLRNEDETVGAVKLQELMADDLSIGCVELLRLAMTTNAGSSWTSTFHLLESLASSSFDRTEATQHRLSREIDEFATSLAKRYSTPPKNKRETKEITETLIAFLDRERLRAKHPAYAQGDWLAKIERSIVHHLCESSRSAADWPEALDTYDGCDSVSLMTIHKSKGLEFHTVIFIGLDDRAWWGYSKDAAQETAGFFVAFTRAKQRVTFTYCSRRGTRSTIQPLYELLQLAGVPTIVKDDQHAF